MPALVVEFINSQATPLDETRLRDQLLQVIAEEPCHSVSLNVLLVDDAEIRRLNREFLDHDWATDVISFSLSDEVPRPGELVEVDGELVVSVETAVREAARIGWSVEDELLLYCAHGFLHLCGYDDLTDDARASMRQRERELLAMFGLEPQGLQP